MEMLLNFLHTVYPLSADLETHLRSILKCKTIRKKEFLLKAGRICENVYFIEKGLFRCFFNKDDTEVCRWFMKEGDVMFTVKSFYEQMPSYESIQALEDCQLYYITFRELQEIYKQFIEFNVHRGKLTEKYYLLSEERSSILSLCKSEDRYRQLLDSYPDLLYRVPAKYLASYIRVSIPTMARLRARKRKRI